jgi:hypothetical protein
MLLDNLQTIDIKIMGIKTGPKRIAKSTNNLNKRQRDNKETPKNHSSLNGISIKKATEY